MTTDELREILENEMEDTTVPDAILLFVEENQGKSINSRQLTKLLSPRGWAHPPNASFEGIPNAWEINKAHGMTHLETKAYRRDKTATEGADSFSFLVAHEIVNVTWPTPEEFMEKNASHYAGAQERNQARLAILNDPSGLEKAAAAITEAVDTREAFLKAKAAVEGNWTDWGKPLWEARYLIQGIIEPKPKK
jgi:hypothetical protein